MSAPRKVLSESSEFSGVVVLAKSSTSFETLTTGKPLSSPIMAEMFGPFLSIGFSIDNRTNFQNHPRRKEIFCRQHLLRVMASWTLLCREVSSPAGSVIK